MQADEIHTSQEAAPQQQQGRAENQVGPKEGLQEYEVVPPMAAHQVRSSCCLACIYLPNRSAKDALVSVIRGPVLCMTANRSQEADL